MELKTYALVLRVTDYGENDRLVTLLTAERGKVTTSMKGVRKSGAKLKFASQPFCFAEYVLAERGGRYTVTSASLNEDFYALRENVDKYCSAIAMLEVLDALSLEEMPSAELLSSALVALGAISSNEGEHAEATELIRFLVRAVSLSGYPLEVGECPACGGELVEPYFRFESGGFYCKNCGGDARTSVSTISVLKSVLEGEEITATTDEKRRTLRLLFEYLKYRTDRELKSLFEYVKTLSL